jgi:hypothetical protein
MTLRHQDDLAHLAQVMVKADNGLEEVTALCAWDRVSAPAPMLASLLAGKEEDFEEKELGGKWVLRVGLDEMPELWPTIRRAVEAGKLGPEAKTLIDVVSGECVTQYPEDGGTTALIVYTLDWRDEADCNRVLRGLRSLGAYHRATYKRDIETLDRCYGPGTSIYWAPEGALVLRRTKAYASLLARTGDLPT